MERYTDKNGKEWVINLSFLEIERVKEEAGIDLLEMYGSENLLSEIYTDQYKMLSLLTALVEKQIDDKDVFLSGLDMGVLRNAMEALQQEFINFHPEEDREVLQIVLEKTKAEQQSVREELKKKIGPLVEQQLKKLGSSAVNSLESLVSSSGDTPSGS